MLDSTLVALFILFCRGGPEDLCHGAFQLSLRLKNDLPDFFLAPGIQPKVIWSFVWGIWKVSHALKSPFLEFLSCEGRFMWPDTVLMEGPVQHLVRSDKMRAISSNTLLQISTIRYV